MRQWIGLAAAVVAATGSAAPTHAATATTSAWSAKVEKDAITDKVSREVCAERDAIRLCFDFDAKGVWATATSTGTALFDTQLFPALRVDQEPAIEGVTAGVIALERTLRSQMIPRAWQPRQQRWRVQVPSRQGGWQSEPPLLIRQMISGQSMLVRVYLSGGMRRDVTFNLTGFCTAAASVYAQEAPPLICP